MTLAESATLRLLANRLRSVARDVERHTARRNPTADAKSFVQERVMECRNLAALADAIAEGRESESMLVDFYARIGQLSEEVAVKRATLHRQLEELRKRETPQGFPS